MKNVCIVGFGAIGPIHAKALADSENANLYAVCDIVAERAEKAGVKVYTDFDMMLQDSNIDSVHICTPHYLHFEMIKKALAAGKDVVCEKPVTMTKEEFLSLLELENSDKVCVVLQNRLNPCIEKIRELMPSLGKPVAMKGILTWHRSKDYYDSEPWRGKWKTEGGGLLINQAVHTLDLLGYLGGGFKSVQALMTNFSLKEIEVEDTFTAHLSFDGFAGIFFATNAYATNSSVHIEVAFEKDNIRYIDSKLYLNDELICEDVKAAHGKSYWGSGHALLFKNYYDKGEYFSPHDIKNTMNTMFAMYESAGNNGKSIDIKE